MTNAHLPRLLGLAVLGGLLISAGIALAQTAPAPSPNTVIEFCPSAASGAPVGSDACDARGYYVSDCAAAASRMIASGSPLLLAQDLGAYDGGEVGIWCGMQKWTVPAPAPAPSP